MRERALPNSRPLESANTESIGAASPEWPALLECASPIPDSASLRELLRNVSWPAFVELAEEHGVIALLSKTLQSLNEGIVPPEITQKIREGHRAQAFSTLKMTAELFRLVDLFRTANLDTMLVKGPTLAVRAYGDTGARQYGDLDFLVRQRDIFRATEIMTAAGYQPEISLDIIRAKRIPGQYIFMRTSAPLLIELHTERTMRYFPRGLPLEQFFSRRQFVPVDGHDVPALSIEDELILICIHGAKHLWERLTLIADVAAFVARQNTLDWEYAFANARRVGGERMLNTGLLLAQNLLHAPLSKNVQTQIRGDATASRVAKQIAHWLPAAGRALPGLVSRAIYRMRMRGSAFSGFTYLLRLTFSPTQEDWAPVEGENSGGKFATVRRPFRLAKKYRGAEKKS